MYCFVGWLNNPDAWPSFADLEVIMHNFINDPLRYILTVVSVLLKMCTTVIYTYTHSYQVDGALDNYDELPTTKLERKLSAITEDKVSTSFSLL